MDAYNTQPFNLPCLFEGRAVSTLRGLTTPPALQATPHSSSHKLPRTSSSKSESVLPPSFDSKYTDVKVIATSKAPPENAPSTPGVVVNEEHNTCSSEHNYYTKNSIPDCVT